MKTWRLELSSRNRMEMIDITGAIQDYVRQSGVESGECIVYCPHTTAAVTINEGADPDVVRDILETLDSLVPRKRSYHHAEGNADSHIKTSLMGPSHTVLVEDASLILGTWQKIFFCEFDGPRKRKVIVRVR